MIKHLLTLIIIFLSLGPAIAEPGLSRQSIQMFFVHNRGNSTRDPDWARRFQNHNVQWEGEVYKVEDRPGSYRKEIMVRVLPDSLLYDTVVVLEGNIRLPVELDKGDVIRFEGRILRGVDVLGVKQVQVLSPSPEAITILKATP